MSLTYQPFAEVPEIAELRNELRVNVPESERIVSVTVGAALIAAGLTVRGAAKWGMLALGAALVRRGWLGHCPVCERLQLNKRLAEAS